MEVSGVGDELEFGANLFGEFLGIVLIDDAVRFAGKEESLFLEREIGDGVLCGELGGGVDFADARNFVATAAVGNLEGFFEHLVVMRDEEEAGSNVVSEKARYTGRKWDKRGNETSGAGGNWREEDKFFVD